MVQEATGDTGFGKKTLVIIGVMLVLWVAIFLLKLVVYDRKSQAHVAQMDIARSWGQAQVIAGPFLQHALTPTDENGFDAAPVSVYMAATATTATAQLETQVRKRSVHTVTVYTAQIDIAARFSSPMLPVGSIPSGYEAAGAARIMTLYVADVSGLEGLPTLEIAGETIVPYTLPGARVGGGTWLAWTLPSNADVSAVTLQATVRGVSRLGIVPSAAGNDIAISGTWPHPSFDGARLPDDTQVTDAGFEGRWSVSALASGMPMHFSNHQLPDFFDATLGVSLLPDVDPYKMLDRATKYGLMIVALTFLILFLFEARGGAALHPIPYLLMGSALVLFFMSLLSLSEYVPFSLAYALSAAIVIGMIGGYAKAVLATHAQVITLSACLVGLYGLLYALLKLQDFAMLGGTALLLSALGGTMYLTRDIDWTRSLAPPMP